MDQRENELVGCRIGNYVITGLLGRGGMGAVYLAENPEIKRRVAIKLLPAELTRRAASVERFIAEARAVASIDHPNIIDIYDFGRTEDGTLYYVMEALAGRELSDVLREAAPLSATDALPYVEQICAALAAVHQRGVIHRDLKPSNIFVLDGAPLRLKLLDFGLAKLLEPTDVEVTATGIIVGTPLSMAPEQASGQVTQIGPQTDIYALGVILYWMLSGAPPFSGPPAALVAFHMMQPPKPLRQVAPQVSPDVAELVERCLEKKPAARPAHAAELAEAFARAAASAGGPISPGSAAAAPRSTDGAPSVAAGGSAIPEESAATAVALAPPGGGAGTGGFEVDAPTLADHSRSESFTVDLAEQLPRLAFSGGPASVRITLLAGLLLGGVLAALVILLAG